MRQALELAREVDDRQRMKRATEGTHQGVPGRTGGDPGQPGVGRSFQEEVITPSSSVKRTRSDLANLQPKAASGLSLPTPSRW